MEQIKLTLQSYILSYYNFNFHSLLGLPSKGACEAGRMETEHSISRQTKASSMAGTPVLRWLTPFPDGQISRLVVAVPLDKSAPRCQTRQENHFGTAFTVMSLSAGLQRMLCSGPLRLCLENCSLGTPNQP